MKNAKAVLNDETRTMISMVRENRGACADVVMLCRAGKPATTIAALVKHRVREVFGQSLYAAGTCPFTRAALETAIDRTVDWVAVVEVILFFSLQAEGVDE